MRTNLTPRLTASMRNESISDVARSLAKKRAPKKHPAAVARGLVALEYALRISGLKITEFGRKYADRSGSARSGLIFKWFSGETVPSRSKIERIDADCPGTLELYDSVFFDLLADLPLSVGQIENHLSQYQSKGPFGQGWEFLNGRDSRPVLVHTRCDTRSLLLSNHLHGFTIILGLVREAEALGRTLDHMEFMADLYRSLPSLLSISCFRRHRRLISSCVQRVHLRDLLSYCLTRVDWAALRRISRKDVQSRITDAGFRQLFWRKLERAGIDPIEFIDLPFPPLLRNPLDSALGDRRRTKRGAKRKKPRSMQAFEETLSTILS